MAPQFRVASSHIWYDPILEVDLDVELGQIVLHLSDPPEYLSRERLYAWVASALRESELLTS